MNNKQDGASVALQDPNTPPVPSALLDPSISSGNRSCQDVSSNSTSGNSKRFDKKKHNTLPITAKVYSAAIKIYEEQLQYGWDYTAKMIRMTDSKDFHVLAIRHDRDIYAEEDKYWLPAVEKPHYHIIFRCTDTKKRIRIRTVMQCLGIYFRPGLDDDLWTHHGVETVGNFAGYATYLTHETEDAIRDGKELYDLSEIVSNLTIDEIKEVREGYLRVSENCKKMTTKDWVQLDEEAYKLGQNFGDLDAWYGSLPFTARSGAKIKTIRESYDRGVRDRANENMQILRTCIFIRGPHDKGKTYAARKGLGMPGKYILPVGGGGSGKFDKLQPYMQAILIDDDVCPNLLNMSDNYICQPYRRNSNNPYWTGEYLVVTSNKSFEDWLEYSGLHIYKKQDSHSYGKPEFSEHYYAAKSRFYIFHIEDNGDGVQHLILDSASNRGEYDEQKERMERVLKFVQLFNATIADYVPNAKLDVDKYFDPESLPLDRAIAAHPDFAAKKEAEKEAEKEAAREQCIEKYPAEEMKRFDILVEFAHWFWSNPRESYEYGYDEHMGSLRAKLQGKGDEHYEEDAREMQVHIIRFKTIGGFASFRVELYGYEYQYLQMMSNDDDFFRQQIYRIAMSYCGKNQRKFTSILHYSTQAIRGTLAMVFYDEL